MACDADADCESGLLCITADSTTLGAAVPHGLCTKACEADTECSALIAGSYCVAFDEDATVLYCILGCLTGTPGIPKCHERTDIACSLLGLNDTDVECTTADDCEDTQFCNEDTGFCGDTVTGCLPLCGGVFDCESGQSCDFLSGFCVPGEAEGLPIGAECDPAATTDPCLGFCQVQDAEGTEGSCAGFCSLNPDLIGCGWSGTGTAEAACLYGTRLSPPDDLQAGDLGICGALCDCNDDCGASIHRCVDESDGQVMAIWGRAGYCRPLLDTETEDDAIACDN
jgi:hypothetical protein